LNRLRTIAPDGQRFGPVLATRERPEFR
jgi:hypothetical protein